MGCDEPGWLPRRFVLLPPRLGLKSSLLALEVVLCCHAVRRHREGWTQSARSMGTLGEQIREDTAGTLPWGHGVFVPSRQSPPASPLLEDLGLDRSNPSSPWSIHGLPPSPPVPATGTGQEWGPPGFSTPAAPEPWHGHVPSPPAHSLLSAFSTQKRAAALHGRWREDAARGQLGAAAGTPGAVAGSSPRRRALTRSLCLSLPLSLPAAC